MKQWTLAIGHWPYWTFDIAHCTLHSGQWAVGSGQWAVDSETMRVSLVVHVR